MHCVNLEALPKHQNWSVNSVITGVSVNLLDSLINLYHVMQRRFCDKGPKRVGRIKIEMVLKSRLLRYLVKSRLHGI